MPEQAVRLDRKPKINIGVEQDGVHFSLNAVLHGDAADWNADTVGTFLMDIWEAARQTAQLHRTYGITVQRDVEVVHVGALTEPRVTEAPRDYPLAAVTPPAEPPMPARATLTIAPPSPAVDRKGRISRVVGVPTAVLKAQTDQERAAILRFLQDHEATRKQLQKEFAAMSEGALKTRLRELREQELVYFRHTAGGNPNFGFYGVLPAGKAALGASAKEDVQEVKEVQEAPAHPLTVVLPYTTGKTLLMLGGRPDLYHMRAMEAALRCHMRWPVISEQAQYGMLAQIRQQIEKPDVDYVLMNRFNRKASREYGHLARAAGKPFIVVSAGLNPMQIAEQFRVQYVERLGEVRRAA